MYIFWAKPKTFCFLKTSVRFFQYRFGFWFYTEPAASLKYSNMNTFLSMILQSKLLVWDISISGNNNTLDIGRTKQINAINAKCSNLNNERRPLGNYLRWDLREGTVLNAHYLQVGAQG